MEKVNFEILDLLKKVSTLLESFEKFKNNEMYEVYTIISKFHSDLSLILGQFNSDRKDSIEHLYKFEEDTLNKHDENEKEFKEEPDLLASSDNAKIFNTDSVMINFQKQLENQENKNVNECSKCLKSFKFKGHMKKHMKICLNKKKEVMKKSCETSTYICSDCGKVYATKSGLDLHHKIVHLKVKKSVICNQCGKDFISKGELNKHLRSHEEKKPCQQCGKMVSRLDIHMKTVHTPDELQKYRCQDCGRGFFSMKVLKNHRMNVHLKLRPYKCRYGCDIAYNDRSNLRQHEKRVHGEIAKNILNHVHVVK